MRSLLAIAVVCAAAACGQQTIQPPAELESSAGPRDFDLRGNSQELYEKVAAAYGFHCAFDSDFRPGQALRFQLREAGFRAALIALEAATGTFTVPLSKDLFLVSQDTAEKRRQVEPHVATTVEIPQTSVSKELTELVTAVQQALAIEKVAVELQHNRVVLRGAVSKIVPARILLENMIRYTPQVSIELELLEVNRSDLLTYGVDIPRVFSATAINAASSGGSALSTLGKGALGGIPLGVTLAGSALKAQLTKSQNQLLMHLELRSLNQQPVTFHAGDRYPIVSATYAGGTATTGSTSTSGSTSSASSTGISSANQFGDVANATAAVVADFNRDGIPDVAAASADDNAAAVMIASSSAKFRSAVTYNVGSAPAAIASADFDSDGYIDLVTANASSNNVSVLLGRGNGTFGAAASFPTGTKPVSLAIADFDRNGFPDIVTANADSNDLTILLGDGNGSFTPGAAIPAGSTPRAVVTADFKLLSLGREAMARVQRQDAPVARDRPAAVPGSLSGPGPLDRRQRREHGVPEPGGPVRRFSASRPRQGPVLRQLRDGRRPGLRRHGTRQLPPAGRCPRRRLGRVRSHSDERNWPLSRRIQKVTRRKVCTPICWLFG